MVCTVTTMPHGQDDGLRRVDHDGVLALVDAAERARVRRFVYVSYSGAIEEPSPLEKAKRAVERRLRQGKMDAVILRPSYFMEAWLGRNLDLEKNTFQVFGEGTAPVSFVSGADVAEIAVAVLGRPVEGQFHIEIGGPEPVAPLEAVRRMEAVLGRALRVNHVPMQALSAMQASDDPVQSTFGALGMGCAKGNAIPNAVETAAKYGVRLRTIEDFMAALAAPKPA